MFDLLSPKKNKTFGLSPDELRILLAKITQIYRVDEIEQDRMEYFSKTIAKYGYLPYPQYKVLQELTPAEAIFCLIEKLKHARTFINEKFVDFKNPSALARNHIKNSSWFKKEGHDIKLLSLSALGDGNDKDEPGHFIDWIKCLITLNSGNLDLGIFPTTLYLIPFSKREFDCAYLPKSSEVSENLQDDNLLKFLGLDVTSQVKLFIQFAQLCNHPVIYDILPQTARFSKAVLANPYIARWLDVNELIDNITDYLQALCGQIMQKRIYDEADILKTKKIYIENLKGNSKKYNGAEQNIAYEIEEGIRDYKILISYEMSFQKKQEELVKKAQKVINRILRTTPTNEDDIINQDEITKALIEEGLWTYPGGAWCSAGVPVFDKMAPKKAHPVFKHYNFKGEDVTHFANLDCQTPYFFYHFEINKYNNKVIDFYIDYMAKLQESFNFDGFRVDHIDHIVDEVSQNKSGQPISYRIPSRVLNKVNTYLKNKIPYFATLAEYMLWDGYFKEYHKDMKFDLLWGDDIVSQYTKTPEQIINDNLRLSNYNQKNKNNFLSILKTYNNQDGEFRDINQYPGQLGPQGALFKWFKIKFIPGGKFAPRPTLLVDGDESFTKVGIERIISKETSMVRNQDWGFYEKFNALNYFSQHDKLINQGKAILHTQNNNGFAAWEIIYDNEKSKKDENSYSYLVVVNYFSPSEIKDVQNKDGNMERKNVKGCATKDNKISLTRGKKLVSCFDFATDELGKCIYKEQPFDKEITEEITFKEIFPGEFKVYKMI